MDLNLLTTLSSFFKPYIYLLSLLYKPLNLTVLCTFWHPLPHSLKGTLVYESSTCPPSHQICPLGLHFCKKLERVRRRRGSLPVFVSDYISPPSLSLQSCVYKIEIKPSPTDTSQLLRTVPTVPRIQTFLHPSPL